MLCGSPGDRSAWRDRSCPAERRGNTRSIVRFATGGIYPVQVNAARRVTRRDRRRGEPLLPLHDQHFWDGAAALPVWWIDLLDMPDLCLAIVLKLTAAVTNRAHVEDLLAEVDGDLGPWTLQIDARAMAHGPPPWRLAGLIIAFAEGARAYAYNSTRTATTLPHCCRRSDALTVPRCKRRIGEGVMVYLGNCEPTLDEVFDDPIVRLVMARDHLPPEEVRVHIEAAQRRLRDRRRSTEAHGFI
jgi:hypothetical protein